MHASETIIDDTSVEHLVAAQFPEWTNLSKERVRSAGTDHVLYRLGDTMVVRLPRIAWAQGQAEKEWQWLPRIAPHLPLTIPIPIASGKPTEDYPWQWSVCPWLDGENAVSDRIADPVAFAETLAGFITALQRVDTAGAPLSGEQNFGRGVPLALRDAPVRAALGQLSGRIDIKAATAAWERALRVPTWDKPPVWVHGDLQSGNLLVVDGKLSAVIDFGGLGVGDPAVDLIVAWNLLSPNVRRVFRAALGADDATWERGRGWALSIALIALPYYWDTNPEIAAMSRRTLRAVLTDN